jgi:predicted transcriptional regulator
MKSLATVIALCVSIAPLFSQNHDGAKPPACSRPSTDTPATIEGIGRGEAKRTMHIEIHDAALEARIQKQIHATGSASAEEALLHLLETQEEQDRWLIDNRDAIDSKIRRGIAQLDRGEGIPEDELDAWLTEQKAKPE